MTLRVETITDREALLSLREPWEQLAQGGGTGALFRSPSWLIPWWDAYRAVLAAEPLVMAGWDGDQLICLAPLYRRISAVGPGIKVNEIRLMGDAGPRPPAMDVLSAPGREQQAASAIAAALRGIDDWDVMDLEPLRDPSRMRAYLVQELDATGRRAESSQAGGARRIALTLAGLDLDDVLAEEPTARLCHGESELERNLAVLLRLSRLEWGNREELSPFSGPEAAQMLQAVTRKLVAEGRARLVRIDSELAVADAIALVVDDGDRAVVVALAVDPEVGDRCVTRLMQAEARAAVARGRTALDVVIGAEEYAPPPLPSTRQYALRLRIYNTTRAGQLARTYGKVRRRVDAARDAPGAAAAGARAAWSRIRGAASQVANYGRLHLYRGELWTRGLVGAEGLELGEFTAAQFEVMDERDRFDIIQTLELDEQYCLDKWARGDFVVLARIDGHPAGIAWSARSEVMVPEIGRAVRPGVHECYIHDVFVASHARGRRVAPSMLEFLAGELRQQDIYRSWALIGPTNIASIRAFEKAAYTAVADVVYARMAKVGRVTVRPPDPEAKLLLGL